ncbi:MAG: tetrahydrofolate dehydrogenase/cyclohydrolase catalytic domain-containing protein [candidate division WOR-3 bacterium]
MSAELLDGRVVSERIREDLIKEILSLKEKGISPFLKVLLVGSFPPSLIYVRNKENACARVGIRTYTERLPADVPEEKVLALIREWNQEEKTSGILIQLPLPEGIRKREVFAILDPKKDVDGLTPTNLGLLLSGEPYFFPCTPLGVLELLQYYGVEIKGKNVVIVGRGELVGKPLANLLLRKGIDATVTVCHTLTPDITSYTSRADIVILGMGKAKFLKGEMIKEGAVVVDCGISKVKEKGEEKIVGDCDFESCAEKASFISPVPGGVGPMTVTMLLKNTVLAAKRQGGLLDED